MELRIKNMFLFFIMSFFLGQNLLAKTTKVSCENKTGINIIVDLHTIVDLDMDKGEQRHFSVEAGKSSKTEWSYDEFLRGAYVGIKESRGMRHLGKAFSKRLEGKYATGPRTVKIVVTNDKIITVITDSNDKNPETIVTDIKPPLGAKKTTVSCENKTGVNIQVELSKHKGEQKPLSVEAGKSSKTEWTSNEFLEKAYVGIKESRGMREIGEAFYRNLEGKYATGPRTVKIIVTNDKIITVITDSEGKNPETIVTDIKPPLG